MAGARARPGPMAPLLDLATAGAAALVAFLVTLGVLVVFVEDVPRRAVAILFLVGLVLAASLAIVGQLGVGLVLLGFAAAFAANGGFEWLTTR